MERIKFLNPGRPVFSPYGLTCEKWKPQASPHLDRHNEIEINYFPRGGATYFFNNEMVEIPAGRMVAFWALLPHQTMSFEDDSNYYVCTIPLHIFLSWKIDGTMVAELLSGKILMSSEEQEEGHLTMLQMDKWLADLEQTDCADIQEIVLLEMKAKMMRLSFHYSIVNKIERATLHSVPRMYSEDSDKVTRMVIFMARNFKRALKTDEIGRAVRLHPDYANRLFVKAFGCTLHQYILQIRVNHAERMLITTDKPITEIAFASGFSTIARFNTAFQKQKGCKPSEYRKVILCPSPKI